MTIALAWTRRVGKVHELVVCTDSRLSGYGEWDCGPKVIPMPRNDCVLAFAGWTLYAYPFIVQALSAVKQHPKALSRALDIEDLKGHLIRVFNHMLEFHKNIPAKDAPAVQFLLAGWSWKRNRFITWVIHYDQHIQRFTHRRVQGWSGTNGNKYLAFIGDYFEDFKKDLITKLRTKGNLASGAFDMEPFEVLRDMLRSNAFHAIGGAPQLAKVYRHSNVVPHAIHWPDASSKLVSLLGRPLLPYETSQFLLLDPDTLLVKKHD